MTSAEEFVAVAAEGGIEMTTEDANKIRLLLTYMSREELTDDDLEEVIGGDSASDYARAFFTGFLHPFSSIEKVIKGKIAYDDLLTWGQIGDEIVSKIPFV